MHRGANHAPYQMLAPSATTHTHTHTIFFIHTHRHTACCCFLLIHSSSSSTIYSGLCCSRSKQATALLASPATCCCRPCLIPVSAAKTSISTVQRSCTMKADHLTKKREKDDVGASSHTSAKPFILKPIAYGANSQCALIF